MKGFIGKVVAVLGSVATVAGMSGCEHLRDLYDPCYPERYWYASRQNVHAGIAPQVRNGHILDQTVWNYHFECGTDRLTCGGMEQLDHIARRRPHPDTCVFMETAHDLCYDQCKPDEYVHARSCLDSKRVTAVKQYLTTACAAGTGTEFEVYIHNPPDVSIAGPYADYVIRSGPNSLYNSGRATLPAGGAGGGGGGGGGGAAGGGGGR